MAILHLSENDFDSTVAEGVTLVDFFATWCGPCKMIAPVLDKVDEQFAGKAKIAKVDIDKEGALAARFSVMSVPTLLLFKNGEKVGQVVGAQSQAKLAAFIEEAL